MSGFRKGDRVQLSADGRASEGRRNLGKQGRVTTDSRNPWSVAVLWDGNRSPTRYHVDFIERVQEGETEGAPLNDAAKGVSRE